MQRVVHNTTEILLFVSTIVPSALRCGEWLKIPDSTKLPAINAARVVTTSGVGLGLLNGLMLNFMDLRPF